MADKRKKKSKKKKRRKVARRVDVWIHDGQVTSDELMLAGLGVMAQAAERKKKKLFKKALSRGERLLETGLCTVPALRDRVDVGGGDEEGDTDLPAPVIAYRPKGGGWFSVEVGGIEVENVQGEEPAAARAAAILQAYAELDGEEQSDTTTGVEHAGGGWYTVKVRGVPVDRVRGRDEAERRIAELGLGAEPI